MADEAGAPVESMGHAHPNVRRLHSLPLDELAISFLGRPELDHVWRRLSNGELPRGGDETLVLLAESRAHERAGRLSDAVRTAQQAIDLAGIASDDVALAGGFSHLAYAEYRLGERQAAIEHAGAALEAAGPHAHTVTAHLVLGLIAVDACEWDDARDRFVTARTWSTEIGYPLGVMLALHNLSVMYFHTGRFDLALGAANDVDRLNREIRYPGWAYPWTRAMVSQLTGDRVAARQALADLDALNPAPAFAAALGRMLEAQLHLDEENVDESERSLVAARVDAERLGNPMARAMVLLVTSRVRRARGDAASAQGWIDEACAEVQRAGLATLEGWMQVERARVRWELGDHDGAEQQLRQARELAETRSAAHVSAEATMLLAAILSDRSHTDAGREWVEAARRVRDGGYGFLIERERRLLIPRVAALARSTEPGVRAARRQLLELLASATPVPLRLFGLGRFEARQGRRPVDADSLRRRRAGELLRFLLLQRTRRASRDQIIEAIWPDLGDGAQAQLHQATSMLRRALEPDLPDKFPSRYVRTTGDLIELVLPPGSVVDFDRFEVSARQAVRDPDVSTAALTEALELYAGELFPDDRYADWAADRRLQLAHLAASAGATLAARLLATGDALGALDVASAAIERDPLREQAIAVGMQASLAMGDRIGALRLYRRFAQSLSDDLGVPPGDDLRTLAASLGAIDAP